MFCSRYTDNIVTVIIIGFGNLIFSVFRMNNDDNEDGKTLRARSCPDEISNFKFNSSRRRCTSVSDKSSWNTAKHFVLENNPAPIHLGHIVRLSLCTQSRSSNRKFFPIKKVTDARRFRTLRTLDAPR